jgi:hypothetical protein
MEVWKWFEQLYFFLNFFGLNPSKSMLSRLYEYIIQYSWFMILIILFYNSFYFKYLPELIIHCLCNSILAGNGWKIFFDVLLVKLQSKYTHLSPDIFKLNKKHSPVYYYIIKYTTQIPYSTISRWLFNVDCINY